LPPGQLSSGGLSDDRIMIDRLTPRWAAVDCWIVGRTRSLATVASGGKSAFSFYSYDCQSATVKRIFLQVWECLRLVRKLSDEA